jgi:hypothetical protein
VAQETGDISWGEGFFQNSKLNAVFLHVRWANSFHLIKCLNLEDELEIVEGYLF